MVEKLIISPNFSLNWRLKLRFAVLPRRPTPSLIKDNKWIRAIRMDDRLIPLIVESIGSEENPKLLVLTPKLRSKEKRKIRDFILEFHGIKDVREFYNFMAKDKVLKEIKDKLYGFGRAGLMSATIYEGIIKAILQQQISLKVAETITANLVENYGDKTEFCGEYAYDFPSPKTIADLTVSELRKCGLSLKKAEYIKEFSATVLKGFEPEKLKNETPTRIMECLTAFRGIGRWTAELVMVASIGLNVIPADDLGVRKAISHFYFNDKLQSPETIRSFAEKKFGRWLRDCLVYLLMAYRTKM